MPLLFNSPKVYQTTTYKLSGSDFREVNRQASYIYLQIKRKSKRRPYIRSAYFKRDKVFLELFWHRIREQQNFRDKIRRLKYFPCAIELLMKSRCDPVSKENPNRRSEILHRFIGRTPANDIFFVQIKADKKSGEKWLVSIFPAD